MEQASKPKWYKEGWQAYYDGDDEDSCPYKKGQGQENHRRIQWFNGFLDARTKEKFGNLFKEDEL